MGGSCSPATCLFWLLVLIFVSWPVAFFCFVVFLLVGPLAGCIEGLEPAADALIEGVKFPQTCAKNMCG